MPAPIVLVHDDPLYVATARDLLNDAGYEVASFTNSFEALDALEAGKTAELLIVRADMPTGMPSGVSLALTARQRRKGIKVLFLAGSGPASIVELKGYVSPESELLGAVEGLLIGGMNSSSTPRDRRITMLRSVRPRTHWQGTPHGHRSAR